jgi:hypothetical protein
MHAPSMIIDAYKIILKDERLCAKILILSSCFNFRTRYHFKDQSTDRSNNDESFCRM